MTESSGSRRFSIQFSMRFEIHYYRCAKTQDEFYKSLKLTQEIVEQSILVLLFELQGCTR